MGTRRTALLLVLIFASSVFALWPVAAQDGADSAVQVGVVILGSDGQLQTYCVSLDETDPTGAEALQATGVESVSESGARGLTVCRIEADGCDLPDESCFCQCEGGPSCAYWSYFYQGTDNNWQYSVMGAGVRTVAQGDVEGWWWRDNARPDAPGLPEITFDAICGPQSVFPRVVVDSLGREVMLTEPPQRIASVSLGSDEILLELVGPERLLGVTYFAADPAISNIADQLTDIPHTDLIGNPEYLISLDADLVVLTAYNNPAALDQLLDADVPVFVLAEFNSLDNVRANIRLLGQITGAETRANDIISTMDGRIAALAERVANFDPVRVLYYEPGGISYGPGSTVDEIITLTGGVNVIGEAGLGAYPLIDTEFVIATDPDVILVGGWFSGTEDPLAWFSGDAVFSTLRAVQQGRVVAISDAHMTTVSQYAVLGVEEVARALYPEAFEDEQ